MTKEVRDMIYEDGVKVGKAWKEQGGKEMYRKAYVNRLVMQKPYMTRENILLELIKLHCSCGLQSPKVFADYYEDEELFGMAYTIFLVGLTSE